MPHTRPSGTVPTARVRRPRTAPRTTLLLAAAVLAATAAVPVLPTAPTTATLQAQRVPKPVRRAEYFQARRAFPYARIPEGAMERARRDAMQRYGPLLMSGRSATISSWTAMGPRQITPVVEQYIATGRLTAIAIHPTDANIIYVGGAQGGVWKTVNGGASWTALTDGQCSLANGDIKLDPTDPQTVYVGTGEQVQGGGTAGYYGCGVLKSTNGGLTWTQLGATIWDRPGRAGAMIARIAIGGGRILVASDAGLHRSTDGGASWTEVAAGFWSDVVMDPTDPNVLWAGAMNDGVYKSTDGGVTFQRLSQGLPAANATNRVNLAVSPSAPNTVYAAVVEPEGVLELQGLFRTDDGGATWAQTATTPACGQCFYDLTLAVDPTDPNTLYFGGVNFQKSVDGGATFQDAGTDQLVLHVDQHHIVFDPTDPSVLFVGNDGGIYRTADGGDTWTSLNTNLELTQFYPGIAPHPTNPDVAFGGTQDNGTVRTLGGTAWNEIACGDGGFGAWDPSDANVLYTECQWDPDGGGPQRSTDGGATFEYVTNGIDTNDNAEFIPPLVMDPSTPSTLYFGTDKLYRTTNRGDSWTALTGDLTNGSAITAIAPAPSDPTVVYVGTRDANVWRVVNGQTTAITSGLPQRAVTDFTVHPTDANQVWITFSGFGSGHVYRSTNGGQSWQDVSGNLPDLPTNAVVLDPMDPTQVYIGTDLGVYQSAGSGGTWQPMNDGMPLVGVLDLVVNAGSGVMLAGTHGRGMYRATLAQTVTTTLSVDPTSRTAQVGVGATAAVTDSATVNLTGTGATNTAWSATHGSAAWLTLTNASGTGSGTVRWTRDPTGLAAGTYMDTITVTAAGATGSPARIVDTFTIQAAALSMTADPTVRVAYATVGAATSSDSTALSFQGTGGAAAAWTAASEAAWISVDTDAGTGSATVRWTRNPDGLAAGSHVASIVLTSAAASGSPVTVTDTLWVAAAIALDAAANALLGTATLSPAEARVLDGLGNADGTYNLGDLAAWLDRCEAGGTGCVATTATAERVRRLLESGADASPGAEAPPGTSDSSAGRVR
ncbi:MAG: hypothetical protein RJQ04_15515 [Longimicrobiales bacterium]